MIEILTAQHHDAMFSQQIGNGGEACIIKLPDIDIANDGAKWPIHHCFFHKPCSSHRDRPVCPAFIGCGDRWAEGKDKYNQCEGRLLSIRSNEKSGSSSIAQCCDAANTGQPWG